LLDRPDILRVLFYPRRDYGLVQDVAGVSLVTVEVDSGVSVGGRLYPAGREAPAILFYHGNGEIAQDYDDLASLYTEMDVTLMVMDYRGYGRSGGSPTASSLLTDAPVVFAALSGLFRENGLVPARLYVMGRSLGSAPAIHTAQQAGEQLAGLIVESGFAGTFPLLARLGARVRGADEERDGFGNLSGIRRVTVPTLVIHGQADVLIPPEDGHLLYQACGSQDKRLVLIPQAGHNDLMMVGMERYFAAIRSFVHGDVGA